ncbi:MAG TPA: sulfonate ABC transporter substrate-binding protein [Telluria sp.]|jgi:sulfonate transport system substrate-binding protein
MKTTLAALRIAALFAALLAPCLAHAAPAPAVRIGYQKGAGLLTMLKNQGSVERAFAPTHQAVTWIEFPAGPQMLEALNAGSIDFGTTGAPPPIFAQAAGIDVVYVGAEPAPVASEALIVAAGSPIRTVAQLKGKKVAFQKGSGSHLLLVSALRRAGLSMRDIVPVYLGPSEARAAFAGGSIDAWVVWDPYLAAAQKAYPVRVLADYTGLLQANGFYLSSRRFLDKSPESVAILLEQIAAAGAWVSGHRKEMVAMLAPQVGVTPDVIETWLSRSRAGVVPVDAAIVANQQRVADLFYQEKLIPKPVTISGKTWEWKRTKR